MSLHPHLIELVPDETARIARAAFPKGHPYLTFRDALGTIFQDEDFAPLYAHTGQPGQIPPDLVVKTQAIDIVEVIAYLLRRSDVVQTSGRTRKSRCERLSPSEAHWSTTKFDGMWKNKGSFDRVR